MLRKTTDPPLVLWGADERFPGRGRRFGGSGGPGPRPPSPPTVSRELRRNTAADGQYRPFEAHRKAALRRRRR
ncbi:hypothetical protein [Pseudonocardia acidicola]|uniref:Uncharacterized protein n=1 Tax=Pseudonocardia acidicola TaxID=2724939 RepID=A0ABX1S9E8_9PSEU|nr:hypothetical protein [Pseudonocardia acidicola]NMH97544.1 hypothetical protein [Pseudonocardia acidicola]